MTSPDFGGEPLLCGYTARQLLELERAATEARDTLAEVIAIAEGANHESRYTSCAEIARQARVSLPPLAKALAP